MNAWRMVLGCAFAWVVFSGLPVAATPLDDYIAKPDPAYTWRLLNTVDGNGYTDYILYMASQNWLTVNEVDRTLWEHHLVITVPDKVSHDTAFMFIEGGSKFSGVPGGNSAEWRELALLTETVSARLRQIPNQPLEFFGQDPTWTEDELIAYGWKKFIDSGDPKWLMRLPMTKAAVRAMDTITAFCASDTAGNKEVNTFVVAGGSKRGWTTWTAGLDDRVIGISPHVIDLLNMSISFRHHFDVLGYYSDQVFDYYHNGIMDYFGTPQLRALEAISEPYMYRHRLQKPKYIVNGSQDEYFLSDSAQFYVKGMEGETRLRYVPNAGHDLDDSAPLALAAWYWALVNDVSRPGFTWVKRQDGTIEVETDGTVPSKVTLWQATNPDARTWLLNVTGPAYYSSTLEPVSPGKYVARVNPPAKGFAAFFVELQYNIGAPAPLIFTTEISVVPDVLPFGPQYTLGAGQDLLDAAYYAGSPDDGSDVQGRWAVLGAPSHNGRRVAFWGLNVATQEAAFYVVNVGDPSSWRRITANVHGYSLRPISWTPDDAALIVGDWRIKVPATGALAPLEWIVLDGGSPNSAAATALASNNWAFTVREDEIRAIPILPNGNPDPARRRVILTNFASAGVRPAWLTTTPDGSSVVFSNVQSGEDGEPDTSDVYRIQNVAEILAAPKVGTTDLSSLAPTSLQDDYIVALRNDESAHYASMGAVTENDGFGAIAVFGEDAQDGFDVSNFIDTFKNTAFDIYVANADGYEADQRMLLPGNQTAPRMTEGGPRVAYTQDVYRLGHLEGHLFMSPVKMTIAITGFEAPDQPEKSLSIRHKQEFFDGSGFYASILGNDTTIVDAADEEGDDIVGGPTTVVTFPTAPERQQTGSVAYPGQVLLNSDISVETPVTPVSSGQIPNGVANLPVVRVMEPAGATFEPALTLTIKYTDAELGYLDETKLRVFRFNEAQNKFSEEIPVKSRNLAENTLTISLASLGTIAVGATGERDSDADGMPDAWEDSNGYDPADPGDGLTDEDSDGLSNQGEFARGLDPDDVDTDNDGYWDGFEVSHGSDPALANSVPAPTNVTGDVDYNGVVNAVDVQTVVNGVLGKVTPVPTDVNGDHASNSVDVQLTVNGVLGSR